MDKILIAAGVLFFLLRNKKTPQQTTMLPPLPPNTITPIQPVYINTVEQPIFAPITPTYVQPEQTNVMPMVEMPIMEQIQNELHQQPYIQYNDTYKHNAVMEQYGIYDSVTDMY